MSKIVADNISPRGSDVTIAGVGTFSSSGVNLTGIVTASSGFVGNVTGNATGLSGSPTLSGITSVSTTNLTVNGNAYPAAGPLSNRNLIINGAMQVAQRGTSGTTSGHYGADRFYTVFNGGAMTTSQESLTSGDPYDAGFRKFVRLTNTTAASGAANYRRLVQLIEAQNIANSGWNYASATSYVTLSFWVRSSVSQEFFLRVTSEDGTKQNYPMSTGTLSADTWTKVTKTIPGNSNITVDNNNGAGLKFEIIPFFGTDNTDSGVTLDTWAAYHGTTIAPDMTSTWASTTNATFDVTGVQLEVGQVATPFEHRSYGQELALCQRYYFSQGAGGGTFTYIWSGDCTSGQTYYFRGQLPVTMRSTPTITLSGTQQSGFPSQSADARSANNFTVYAAANSSTNGAYFEGVVTASSEL